MTAAPAPVRLDDSVQHLSRCSSDGDGVDILSALP
jgi:hypothetical protein